MSVAFLLQAINFSKFKGTADDDPVDRLNHLYTVFFLVLFALASTASALVGVPIACLTPANFPGAYIEYAKQYCWVKNTYYIPMDESIPVDVVKRESEELTYYQWVPFILLFMACLFKLPCFLWRCFNQASGLNIDKINEMTVSLSILSAAKRREGVQHLGFYIDSWIRTHRNHKGRFMSRIRQRLCRLLCVFGLRRNWSYLTLLYVFVKLLYVVNVLGQFFILNAFLGGWYALYGVEVLCKLFVDAEWTVSARFPPVTLCDLNIRQLENVQTFTVQCALPINIYNEKVFVFLWFWLAWVALVTSGSFLLWVWRSFFRAGREEYVEKYLQIQGRLKEGEDRSQVKAFVDDYLRDDGIFLFRLLARNANIIILSMVIADLYDHYRRLQLQQQQRAEQAAGAGADADGGGKKSQDGLVRRQVQTPPQEEEKESLTAAADTDTDSDTDTDTDTNTS